MGFFLVTFAAFSQGCEPEGSYSSLSEEQGEIHPVQVLALATSQNVPSQPPKARKHSTGDPSFVHQRIAYYASEIVNNLAKQEVLNNRGLVEQYCTNRSIDYCTLSNKWICAGADEQDQWGNVTGVYAVSFSISEIGLLQSTASSGA